MNDSTRDEAVAPQSVAVRQLVFTQDVAAWGRLVESLGARAVERFDDYAEYALPGGGCSGCIAQAAANLSARVPCRSSRAISMPRARHSSLTG